MRAYVGSNVVPDVVWISTERLAALMDEAGHLTGRGLPARLGDVVPSRYVVYRGHPDRTLVA